MFDFKCKITKFFAENQIFAGFGANNSIKLDITRYNSISGLSDFVTLQWNSRSEERGVRSEITKAPGIKQLFQITRPKIQTNHYY